MRTLLALVLVLSACESTGPVAAFAAASDTAASGPVTVIGPLTWQTGTGPTGSRASAMTYCSNLVLGTFSDWRLPTIEELKGTIDKTGMECPYIVAALKATSYCGGYWSSTPVQATASAAWGVVLFQSGASGYGDNSSLYDVRCVR